MTVYEGRLVANGRTFDEATGTLLPTVKVAGILMPVQPGWKMRLKPFPGADYRSGIASIEREGWFPPLDMGKQQQFACDLSVILACAIGDIVHIARDASELMPVPRAPLSFATAVANPSGFIEARQREVEAAVDAIQREIQPVLWKHNGEDVTVAVNGVPTVGVVEENAGGERRLKVVNIVASSYSVGMFSIPCDEMTRTRPPTQPLDPLDVKIDGVTLRVLLTMDENRRREHIVGAIITPAQRAAVSAHWSAQLRAKVAASAERDRNQVRVDLDCEVGE